MYRPSLKSIWSLAALALISVVLYYIAQNSYSEIRTDGYEQKIEAANHMKACMEVLRREYAHRQACDWLWSLLQLSDQRLRDNETIRGVVWRGAK